MRKTYLAPTIKASKIVINQIVMTSGGDTPTPDSDQTNPLIPVITDKIEDEGYAD